MWSLVVVVLLPFTVLVHELGHAAVGLARTTGFVRVQVGREPGAVRFRIGRLIVSLDPRRRTDRLGGYARTAGALTPRERLAYALAGPAAEAAFGAVLALLGHEVLGGLVTAVAFWNLVPRKVGRYGSDGWHALHALRGSGVDRTDVEETRARAHVLFASPERYLEPRRRLLELVADDRDPHAVRCAFVGWCWRESQVGSLGETRQTALDALHEATLTGAVEPHLSARAAHRLAQSGSPFGPTFDQTEAALVPQERYAFRYGGALREIEQIRE